MADVPAVEDAIDWKNPDYASIVRARLERLDLIRRTPGMVEGLREFYKDHPADFIAHWFWTYDPRNPEIGLPAAVPFVLFKRQREFIDWLHEGWKGREDGLVEKSRDMGVSWLCMAFGVWMWAFYPGTTIGFGSRKEEYVDDLSDPKSLFWKGRFAIEMLPAEFQPAGWNVKKHAPFMALVNPENQSVVVGEAGDNIGRGARTSVYFVDEAQPLDAKIVTPYGMLTMADMAPGVVITGANGGPTTVTHVNDCGVHDVLRVTLSDGTSVECSPNHLLAVEKVWGKREKLTLRAHELADRLRYESPGGQIQYRYRIPACAPVEFSVIADPLPLDPYIVGALLGDGSVKGGTVRITSADAEVVDQFRRLLPDGVVVGSFDGRYTHNIVDELGRRGRVKGGGYAKSRARELVREAGIAGHGSATKFIPDAYKYASLSDRLSLLQGLMDTDGSATGGSASFYSTSRRLADGVRFVVQSLGGRASLNVKTDARGHATIYDVHVALPDGMEPFRLSRKLSRLRKRKHPLGRAVVSVEVVGRKRVRCITVKAKDGLYLTDNFTVVHNSAHLERPELIDAALSQTTNCRVDVSTPNGVGNPFYKKRHGGKIPVFVFDWHDDPRKDEAWYERQKAKLDPVVLAQEVDRRYEGSVANAFIPGDLVQAAMDRARNEVVASGGLRFGLDVARFGDDQCVLTARRGRLLIKQTRWGKTDLMSTAGRAKAEIEAYQEKPEQIAVDVIGLGAGVADALRAWFTDEAVPGTRETRKIVEDVNSALRMSDGKHYNVRAFMATEVREWLKGASIGKDEELRAELTSLHYLFRGGELLMESKDDAKRRGIKSPDGFDSLALTFAVPSIPRKQRPKTAAHEPAVPGVM